jgi:hypothetical protein
VPRETLHTYDFIQRMLTVLYKARERLGANRIHRAISGLSNRPVLRIVGFMRHHSLSLDAKPLYSIVKLDQSAATSQQLNQNITISYLVSLISPMKNRTILSSSKIPAHSLAWDTHGSAWASLKYSFF